VTSDDSGSSSEEENINNTATVEIDLTTTVNWQEQTVTIDQRAIHTAYKQSCKVNVPSIGLASSSMLFYCYIPLDYVRQHIIHSINI